MRIISFLTAAVVMAALYLMVLQRDRVFSFAGRAPEPAAAAAEEAPLADAAMPAGSGAAGDQTGAVSVLALHSAAQDVPDLVLVRGRTEAARQVEVRAETSGRVISEPLRKGAFVTGDETLCRIDPGTREATLAQAEAALAEARTGLPAARAQLVWTEAALEEARINDNAARRLQEGGYASDSRAAGTAAAVSSAMAGVEAAKSGLKAAQAGIAAAEAAAAAARKEIERLTIAAPFSGVLETDSAELGSLLQPGALCATVLQLDPIKLVGFVAETEVDRLQVGARAGARLTTGREVEGQVSFLSRSADPATRTFRVEVEIANPGLEIRDGQTVEMVLSSSATRAHLLPASALTLDDGGRVGVRIVGAGNQAEFVPVGVLRDTPEGVWLTGLPDFADVIVIGQEYVTEGVPVAPSFEGPGQ